MLPSVNSSSLLLLIAVSITEPLFLPLTLSRIRFALFIFLARTQKEQRCKTHLRVRIPAAVPLRSSVPAARASRCRLCFVGNAGNIMKEAGPVSMTFDIPIYHALRLQVLQIAKKSKAHNPYRWVRYVTQANSYVAHMDLISKIIEERNSIINQNKRPQQELTVIKRIMGGDEGKEIRGNVLNLKENANEGSSCFVFKFLQPLKFQVRRVKVARNIEDVLMLFGDHCRFTKRAKLNYVLTIKGGVGERLISLLETLLTCLCSS
ncbi:hypothetical protein Ahy_A07g035459 isoform D [Arachis hypogaea]|uniref:Uncharacterized protein n=1 Tax=Arachis hypogaea TaxID=3818 RepID=A0A445CDW0_ARAHY|nr:hypothetical protein Ahy_A07g035459 isoform D [Arachis hypogaea]